MTEEVGAGVVVVGSYNQDLVFETSSFPALAEIRLETAFRLYHAGADFETMDSSGTDRQS